MSRFNNEDSNDIVMSPYVELYKSRNILLTGTIDSEMASAVIAQLLSLEAQDPEEDITIYIDSPGGSVSAGMSIYDTMQILKCDVRTIVTGMAASMAAVLLSGGTRGKRYALENSEVMIHQPMSGIQGQASDIKIAADHVLKIKKRLNEIISKNTGKPMDQVQIDTDRDNYMDAEEAIEYGIIDHIMTKEERMKQSA